MGLQNPVQKIEIYSLDSGQWAPGPDLPFPVSKAQTAAAGQKIYLMGGILPDGSISNTFFEFDTISGQWSELNPPPVPTFDGTASVIGNKIFFIGGVSPRVSGDPILTGSLQIYDLENDLWESGVDAPVPVAGSASVVNGNTIWLINGLTSEGTATRSTWIYNTTDNIWNPGPPTTLGVYGASAGIAGDRILLAGGRNRIDGETLPLLQVMNFSQMGWRRSLDPPLPAAEGGATIINGQLMMAGGEISVGTDDPIGSPSFAVQVFAPSQGWSVCNSAPLYTSADVLNSASGIVGPPDLSPGGLATILGHNFSEVVRKAPVTRFENGRYTSDLPTELEGIGVSVDGKKAGILSVSPDRIEIQIPFNILASIDKRRLAVLLVHKKGSVQQAQPVQIPVRLAAPSIFIHHFGTLTEPVYLNRATAQVRNSDGFNNSPSRPASPGERVQLFVTGLGPVSPSLDSGQLAASEPLHLASLIPGVRIDGTEAVVVSAYLEPQSVGIYVVEVAIPEDVSTGNNIEVEIEVAGISSNTAYLSIR
jgi:uncharacterized protein (TIGR03437 family)